MGQRNDAVALRLRRFGTSIFAEMTALATARGAINLGQGYPDFDGPSFVLDAAAAAVKRGPNQYAPMAGLPGFRQAIARRFERVQGIPTDWEHEITVTAGCTGAISAAMLGLLEPGDEVILFEPWYDSYPASVEMAGGTPKYVTLEAPRFRITANSLARAITQKTRVIVVNTPHNPTGRVFDDDEIDVIEAAAVAHDLIVLSDEVYEALWFDRQHRSLLSRPALRDRTIVASSLGKTFSLTGWKIGWTIAPPHLTAAVRAAHQFMIFSVATPLQEAAAAAMNAPPSYDETFRAEYRLKRDLLVEGLVTAGFEVMPPEGTYFVIVDHRPFGFEDDRAFCTHLIDAVGVAAIPVSAFHHDGGGRDLVRFAFCKSEEVLKEAIDRLGRLGRP
jgi:aspartate/methionine/tyrosine aminotransferase